MKKKDYKIKIFLEDGRNWIGYADTRPVKGNGDEIYFSADGDCWGVNFDDEFVVEDGIWTINA